MEPCCSAFGLFIASDTQQLLYWLGLQLAIILVVNWSIGYFFPPVVTTIFFIFSIILDISLI